MNPVTSGSRKVGDAIQVYNRFAHTPTQKYVGTITEITKTYITVETDRSFTRFNRATGFMVGYARTQRVCDLDCIAPETSKTV